MSNCRFLLESDIRDLGIVAIEDPGNFLQGRATGFDVEEVDEEEFDEDPDLTVMLDIFQLMTSD